MIKVLLASFLMLFSVLNHAEEVLTKKQVLSALKQANTWLESQMVPNSVVESPVRNNFILSYEQDKNSDVYKYIFSKSNVYDNALAIIAFTMLGNYKRARAIIAAFQKDSPEGRFFFNYNTHNSWPNKNDHHGAIVRNRASAWMGYSIAYFLKMKSLNDKDYRNTEEFKTLTAYLSKVLKQILAFQVANFKDKRNSFVTGGEGKYSYKGDPKTKKVLEVFSEGKIEWVSVEHSIDIYFSLKEAVGLGLNEFKSFYEFFSKQIVTHFWNDKINQFNRGLRSDGGDAAEALDAASWGSLYLHSIGDLEKALKALKKTEAYLNRSDTRQYGHLPYLNMTVFESYKINQYIYPENPKKRWNDLPMTWYEGTFGVLLAQIKIKGIDKDVKNKLKGLIERQNKNVSFIYSTQEVPLQFSSRPSVASTAWFIIAASSYLVPKIREGFWP